MCNNPPFLWIIFHVYFMKTFSCFTCILHLPCRCIHTRTSWPLIVAELSIMIPPVWSCCVKLHRVQWPLGVSSQLWQMAKAGSGSADMEAFWLIATTAEPLGFFFSVYFELAHTVFCLFGISLLTPKWSHRTLSWLYNVTTKFHMTNVQFAFVHVYNSKCRKP